MLRRPDQEELLAQTWDPPAAKRTLDHWLSQYAIEDKHLSDLIHVFGASNYFSRLMFFLGDAAWSVLAAPYPSGIDALKQYVVHALPWDDTESALKILRQRKNHLMLSILLEQLRGKSTMQETEKHLTCLAETVLEVLTDIQLWGNATLLPRFGIIGMGRLSGHEMNYGSDLDLVFIIRGGITQLSSKKLASIRAVLRSAALPDPDGFLYNIDMRLSPHGHSGSLVTSHDTFYQYHQMERKIWERQIMTRSRVVFDKTGFLKKSLDKIHALIYDREYSAKELALEIVEMRQRVEREFGKKRYFFELKRGHGGIMDIDFISHYFQLLHGATIPALQQTSTRKVLEQLGTHELIAPAVTDELLFGYEFLKKIEMALRIPDLRNTSKFSIFPEQNTRLARALGYQGGAAGEAEQAFINDYQKITQRIRHHFNCIFSASL